jgi:hypothetical protein
MAKRGTPKRGASDRVMKTLPETLGAKAIRLAEITPGQRRNFRSFVPLATNRKPSRVDFWARSNLQPKL